MFNIAAAELVFAAVFVAGLVLTWPDPPWQWLTWVGGALAIGLPIVFYPISQTAFLGFDLLFHPPERREFEPPQSRS